MDRSWPKPACAGSSQAWKAVLSNKGILPLLWERHPNHPNLLPAFFDDDPAAEPSAKPGCAKPLFSREGAKYPRAARSGAEGTVLDEGYGAEGRYPASAIIRPRYSTAAIR